MRSVAPRLVPTAREIAMEPVQIIGLIFLLLVAVVPDHGATAHLVLKPVVEAIVRLREEFAGQTGGAPVEHRLKSLEDELQLLRRDVRQLRVGEAFHRAISAPADPVGT
jgi:hypothetical protein